MASSSENLKPKRRVRPASRRLKACLAYKKMRQVRCYTVDADERRTVAPAASPSTTVVLKNYYKKLDGKKETHVNWFRSDCRWHT